MKKPGFRFAVFIGCLTMGLNLFEMTRSTGLLAPFVKPLPYCTVARNAEAFHDNVIRVKARVILHNDAMVVYEHCDDVEALASSVILDGRQTNFPNYVDTVLVGNDEKPKMATAIIEGDFDAHATPGCFAPKFRIYATKVELLSALTEYKVESSDGQQETH